MSLQAVRSASFQFAEGAHVRFIAAKETGNLPVRHTYEMSMFQAVNRAPHAVACTLML